MLSWNCRSSKPLKSALRFNLRGFNFLKFSGGMPPDPLDLACLHARMCAPHTIIMFTTMYLCPPFENPESVPEQ